MDVTLTLDDQLVKRIRKVAMERNTTLKGLIRDNLERVASEDETNGRRLREIDALKRSFKKFRLRVGKRIWRREAEARKAQLRFNRVILANAPATRTVCGCSLLRQTGGRS